MLKKITFTQWIAIALVVGLIVGVTAPEFAVSLKFLTTVFLRAISSMVVPMIFAMLVTGIADHSDDLKSIGRLAVRALVYFEVMTAFALVMGLIAVHLLHPGTGTPLPPPTAVAQEYVQKPQTTLETIEHIVPRSFVEAAAQNDILEVIFFSVLFALALTQVDIPHKNVMLGVCRSLAQIMFKFIGIVMNFAPIAVGASIAVAVGQSGLQVIANLSWLVLTLYLALVALILLFFVPTLYFLKISIPKFFAAVREPAFLAFSTSSSEAALPIALRKMVEFGVPEHIVYFVLPLGYSFNLVGSTLYLSVAAIFVAQAADIHLTWMQQSAMILTLLITSKGVAAVPRASMVVLSATLTKFNLPLEGIAVILGVDAIMDMARSMVNVIGNCLASVVLSHWESATPVKKIIKHAEESPT